MQLTPKVRGLDVLQWSFHVDGLLHNRGPSIPIATIEQAAVYLAQEMHQGMRVWSGNGAGNNVEIRHSRVLASLKSESISLHCSF